MELVTIDHSRTLQPARLFREYENLIVKVALDCHVRFDDWLCTRWDIRSVGYLGLYLAWMSYDKERGSEFGSWAYSIISYQIKDYLKKINRQITWTREKIPVYRDEQLDGSYELEVDFIDLQILYSVLDEKQKEIFSLRYFQGMSCSEIAVHLTISIHTVSWYLGNARRRMRDMVGIPRRVAAIPTETRKKSQVCEIAGHLKYLCYECQTWKGKSEFRTRRTTICRDCLVEYDRNRYARRFPATKRNRKERRVSPI